MFLQITEQKKKKKKFQPQKVVNVKERKYMDELSCFQEVSF